MGTDIVTGEKVVPEKSRMDFAMRISRSIFTVFNPCEVEGRLLVDGGFLLS